MESPEATERPHLSVVVPAFNEARRLEGPLRTISDHLAGRDYSTELVIVDDGSADGTADLVKSIAPELRCAVRVIRYATNRGKGHAIRVGVAHTRGERILFSDADLATPIEEVDAFHVAMDSGCDVVIGSRKMKGAQIDIHQPWYREQMGKVFTLLVRRWLADVSDVTCGFKMFRGDVGRDLFARLRIDDWAFDAELLSVATRRGCSIREVPVRWEDQAGTKVRLVRDSWNSIVGLAKIAAQHRQGVYESYCDVDVDVTAWSSETGVETRIDAHVPAPGSAAPSVHVERQKRFYESRAHDHLRPRADDHYAEKLVARLAEGVGLEPHHRVVEVGASFGRFTFSLLRHCQSVVALDISERALTELAAARDERGIGEERCRVQVGDAGTVTADDVGGPVDAVVGIFILHHLEDVPQTIRALSTLLRPGGAMGFLEPNRRNPLFLAQVLACPDMTWEDEKGMFKLSARGVQRAYEDAGLQSTSVARFGCFPPQVINNVAAARRLEAGIERARVFEPMLPFLLVTARQPGGLGH